MPYDILKRLKDIPGKKAKAAFLGEQIQNEELKDILHFVFNPFIVSGISTKKLTKRVEPASSHITSIKELLNYIQEHKTGRDQDIAIIQDFINKAPKDDQLILVEIVTKNLTIGMSAKSINKVYKENIIPVFEVQLAFPYQDKIEAYGNDDKLYVTQKLDGHRNVTFVTPDEILFFTRKGQPIEGLDQLKKAIESIRPQLLSLIDTEGLVLDGELLAQDDSLDVNERFRLTSKLLRTEGPKENLGYQVFEAITLHDFLNKETSKESYKERRENWLNKFPKNQYFEAIPILDIITKDQIPTWSQKATEKGWEGVMLNAENAVYAKKRTNGVLKVKKMHTADLPIVGFNQAIDGKHKGILQSLNVQLDENNIVQVGSGLSDHLRQFIWDNRDEYLGQIVEIQFFEISENQKGEKSLRFPVFKDFRFDKTIEDLNID